MYANGSNTVHPSELGIRQKTEMGITTYHGGAKGWGAGQKPRKGGFPMEFFEAEQPRQCGHSITFLHALPPWVAEIALILSHLYVAL